MVVRAEVHDDVAQMAVPQIVRRLVDVVGAPLVAVMAQGASAQSVEAWARGEWVPAATEARRLRDAYRIVQTLLETESADVVRGWLIGMNPLLDDRASGLVLADDPDGVIRAARAYRYGQMGA